MIITIPQRKKEKKKNNEYELKDKTNMDTKGR